MPVPGALADSLKLILFSAMAGLVPAIRAFLDSAGFYPHEARSCDLIPWVNDVTVVRSTAHAHESSRRDVVFAPRCRA